MSRVKPVLVSALRIFNRNCLYNNLDHSPTASSPQPQGPTYADYEACVPHAYRNKLQKEVDCDRKTNLHLGEIAHLMVNWKIFAADLGLTEVDISDITANNPQDAEMQRYEIGLACMLSAYLLQ